MFAERWHASCLLGAAHLIGEVGRRLVMILDRAELAQLLLRDVPLASALALLNLGLRARSGRRLLLGTASVGGASTDEGALMAIDG